MRDLTYDVRVYKTEIYRGQKATTYYVRWKVGGKLWRKPFRNAAQADTYRGEIQSAARRGDAFSLVTGEPVSWGRAEQLSMSWYEFACKFADMKWKGVSAKYRQDIARALTAATPAMLGNERGKPDDLTLRTAMRRWAFNTKQRAEAPDDMAVALRWLAANTKPVSALEEAATVREFLDVATSLLNGKRAATSTVLRNKTILQSALDYAIELKLLTVNPVKNLKWKAPKTAYEVDRRSVVNHTQARALLKAVGEQPRSGPRLVAFFAVMYYAGLRPEEVVNLRGHNVTLPDLVQNEETSEWEEPEDAWGELHFTTAAPFAGREWTDDGALREVRALKHRPDGHPRTVPCPPALTRILRAHLAATYGKGPDGQLFWGEQGGELPSITYRRAWKQARRNVFTDQEYASLLVKRVYDLRHACVSTWLNAGVPATQVAEWAGHSVEVLLRIYAKCIVGQDEAAKRRISDALAEE
ncbi:site-specific integrase [Streptosporangium soli]|nr:tyrosine-type recombinase/integrase [Streptosporangium sp. KLBMP 9127]